MDRKELIHYAEKDAWRENPPDPQNNEIYLIRWLLLYIEREVSFAQLTSYVSLMQKHSDTLQGSVKKAVSQILYLAEESAHNDNFFAYDAAVTDILYGLTDKMQRSSQTQSV